MNRGFVYFINQPSSGLTKIGLSIHPKKRLWTLQKQYRGLKLLLTIPTTDMRRLERWFHDVFKSQRVYLEWFNLPLESLKHEDLIAVARLEQRDRMGGTAREKAASELTKFQLTYSTTLQQRKTRTMPVLTKEKERVLMSKGQHTVKLKECTTKRIKSAYPDGEGEPGTAAVLIWTFTSKTKDEMGFNEETDMMTAATIGKANNTKKLMRMMMPDESDEEVEGTDTDDLVGQWFTVRVAHETKGDKTRAIFTSMEPCENPAVAAKKAKAAKPEAATVAAGDDEEDAFAD